MRSENRNAAWAGVFVDELVRGGLREACIASGSRSSPLVVALAERAAGGGLRLVPQVDERSAGFFALGIAKASGRPAAVVTTSGTAAANLLPAVVEAAQSEVPFLVLTADRPGHLRGSDANQTIDQSHLFGRYARFFHDLPAPRVRDDLLRYARSLAGRALSASLGPPGGPVHLNLPFEKPLEPVPVAGDVPEGFAAEAPLAAEGRRDGSPFTAVDRGRMLPESEALDELAGRVESCERGLLVCGPSPEPWLLGPAALALAGATGWPLLADPLSGARFGPGAGDRAVDAYDLLLRSPEAVEALAPDVVLRLGASPTSAALLRFLSVHPAADQIVVDGGERWKDHQALASRYIRADPTALCGALVERLPAGPEVDATPASGWAYRWRSTAAAVRAAIDPLLRDRPFEGTVAAEVARLAPPDATLFVGSSMPVRDLDAFGRPREDRLLVLGHRGASGIDGCVSAALGAAVARQPAPALALLGDLAFYHDMNGLLSARRVEADLTVVVLNNDGGGIFHFLPIREQQDVFEPYVAMPHGLDFSHAAALYGLPFRRVVVGELAEGLSGGEADRGAPGTSTGGDATSPGGVRIVEISSNREENRRRHAEAANAAIRAVRGSLGAPAAP